MDVLDDKLEAGPRKTSRVPPSTGSAALRNAMELTNDYIARNHEDANMFATTFFGVLDPTNGQLLYVNGGHNPPVVLGAEGVKARLTPTGPAVGMLSEAEFRIGQHSLEPGDVLFTYTDGVTDARDISRAVFSEKRMLALLEQPADSAAALLDRVDAALQSHIGSADQFDDITMLAVRRSPRDEIG
jgi:sigma-B regulation protein RsbU (phosphoserine phosphatase)